MQRFDMEAPFLSLVLIIDVDYRLYNLNSGLETENKAVGIRHADHATPFICKSLY
jgi:hypothetical protein